MAPLLIFWVAPDGRVIAAEGSQRKSPPDGDSTVFRPGHKGYLLGRAAWIGDIVYVVIYVRPYDTMSKGQLELLAKSGKNVTECLGSKRYDKRGTAKTVVFVDEYGNWIG